MIEHSQSLRLFYVLSFLMGASLACAETIDVSSTQRMNSLVTSEFKYLEDISGDITLQEVMSRNDDAHWLDIDTPSISFGFTNSTYWLKAVLENRSNSAKTFYLDIAYPKITLASLFLVHGTPSNPVAIDRYTIKTSDQIHNRLIPHRHPVFPITLKANQKTTGYIKLKSQFAMAVPIKLWEPKAFSEDDKKYMLLQGGYFGCMIAMLLYNTFIFFSTKDSSFLYYVLFIASLILFSVVDRGFGNEYLWYNYTEWNFKLYVALVATSIASATGFGRVYLSVSSFSTSHYLSLKIMEVYSWAMALLALLIPSIWLIMCICGGLLLAGLVITSSALYVLKQGSGIAKFYLVAWLVVFTGGVVNVFGNFGIIPFNSTTEHLLQNANMVEAMLLSFGLGYRINILKKENEKANAMAEQERQNTNKQKDINNAKTQFFASMSHEFRTPLTAILGYSELSQDPSISPDSKNKNLKTINQSAQYMLQLINDILDLSKIEAQKMDVEILSVKTLPLVEDVHNFTQVLADSKNIYFKTEFDLPIPKQINTDPTRLKQALINLCSNAIKFTQEGGVYLRVSYKDNMMHFSVEDTGIGMNEDTQKKLFGAFSQADSSTSRKFGGTGLGLYLSKLIANRLDGDITVSSQLGKGSTFTITVNPGDLKNSEWAEPSRSDIHIENKESAPPEKVTEITELPTCNQKDKGKCILVVDDNKVNIQLLEVRLKKMGVTPATATDGIEAIASILNNDFDLVLMDINMPFMDGVTAVKLLRQKYSKLPIYALTGSLDDTSISEYDAAGFTGHLPKPFDWVKIEALVSSA